MLKTDADAVKIQFSPMTEKEKKAELAKLPQHVKQVFEKVMTSFKLEDEVELFQAISENFDPTKPEDSKPSIVALHEVVRKIEGKNEKRLYHVEMGKCNPDLYWAYERNFPQNPENPSELMVQPRLEHLDR